MKKVISLGLLTLLVSTSANAMFHAWSTMKGSDGKPVACCHNREIQPGGTTVSESAGACPANALICSSMVVNPSEGGGRGKRSVVGSGGASAGAVTNGANSAVGGP